MLKHIVFIILNKKFPKVEYRKRHEKNIRQFKSRIVFQGVSNTHYVFMKIFYRRKTFLYDLY